MSKKIRRDYEDPVDEATEAGVKEEFRFNLERARHNILPRGVRKVRVNIWLDDDVVAYFKQRAEQPHAAPYQTQINRELRSVMERDRRAASSKTSPQAAALLNDPQFIASVAAKVKEAIKPSKRRKSAA